LLLELLEDFRCMVRDYTKEATTQSLIQSQAFVGASRYRRNLKIDLRTYFESRKY